MPSIIRKKFINNPEDVVFDALRGLVASNQNLQYHPQNARVIIRSDVEMLKSNGNVTLVAGGGSGHEPFAAGYIGENGLTAAVCGDLFASPPSKHVSDAVESVYGNGGTLIYVINYTGDRLHFGMAAERLKANEPNANVDLIYIDDDVALESKSNVNTTGGRGLAGAAFTLHIAGVLAEQYSASYQTVHETSCKIIMNLGTFGVSLYACALPGRSAMFELGSDELELGLGIHGEAGLERQKFVDAKSLVDIVLKKLCSSRRIALKKGDKICVLLNNLGAVSQLELSIVQGEALTWLISHGYQVERFIVGTLMTSIDGHGLSFTILKIQDSKWIEYLDANSSISKLWHITTPSHQLIKRAQHVFKKHIEPVHNLGVKVGKEIESHIEKCLRQACKVIIENEAELNRLDSACGDGDCGSSMKAGAKGAASKDFQTSFTSADCKKALQSGLNAIVYYGHAQVGNRTMVDALNAATIEESHDWHKIVEEVEKAALSTSKMEAKSGRASYTSAAQQSEVDPGAHAVALWFRALYNTYYGK